MESNRLAGKVAMITGASSGIGCAAVRRFHEEGAWVIAAARYTRPEDVGRILRTFKIKKNVEVTDNGKIII